MFIEGEPQTLLSTREKMWRAAVLNSHIQAGPELRLRFVVSAWKRRGHSFDLDNLVSPVLDVIGCEVQSRKSVWATVELGQPSGVEVTSASPPLPPADSLKFSFANPPLRSVRVAEPLIELLGVQLLGEGDAPCACEIRVGGNTPGLAFGFEGPIKPTIDALWPLLGGTHTRPADHRIRDLRVMQAPEISGVQVALWLL